MSNEYGFFASKDGDRKYGAADLCAYFSDIFTDGVLGGSTSELRVYPNNKMVLNVSAGTAYIKGRFYRPQTVKTITLSDSDDTNARYDLIVIRLDYTKRSVYLAKIDGIPSAEPAVPDIERNENYYDLCLAKIYVKPAASEITAADITDTRFDTALCGIVTGVVDTIDTSELFAQYQAAWNLLMQSFSGDEQAIIAAYDNLNRIRPLEIGGTNLLLNSAFIGTSNWLTAGQGTAVSTSASVLKVVPVAKAYSGVVSNITANVKSGKHILSVYAKADANTYFGINIQSFDSSGAVLDNVGKGVQLTNDWQQILFAFDINPSAVRIMVRFSNSKSESTTPFYVKQPKLEIGTEVTDWSPSPFDTPVGVQRGTITTSSSDGTAAVTFPQAFKAAPNIQLTAHAGEATYGVVATLVSATASGFTVRTNQTSNAVITVAVDWIAQEV